MRLQEKSCKTSGDDTCASLESDGSRTGEMKRARSGSTQANGGLGWCNGAWVCLMWDWSGKLDRDGHNSRSGDAISQVGPGKNSWCWEGGCHVGDSLGDPGWSSGI